MLRLVGRKPDPAKNRDHVLLMVLAERRLASGLPANLEALLQDITCSPIDQVGPLTIDSFIPKTQRKALAAALNSLLASPNIANWRQGTSIDREAWLTPRKGRGRTPGVIVRRGIQLFEVRTGKLKSVIPVRSERNYLDGIPSTLLRFKDANRLTTITPDNEIRTWDLRQGHELLDITEPQRD